MACYSPPLLPQLLLAACLGGPVNAEDSRTFVISSSKPSKTPRLSDFKFVEPKQVPSSSASPIWTGKKR